MNATSKTLQDQVPDKLKAFMGRATDVDHWNQLRRIAKSEYPVEIISLLDASAFIIKVLHKAKSE